MNKIINAVSVIFKIIALILMIITIIMLIIKLSGYSPAETTITYSILGILVAFQIMIIGILLYMKEDLGSLKEFKRQTIEFQKQTVEKIKNIEKKI